MLGWIGVVVGAALAAAPDTGGRPISLEEAVALAKRNAPVVVQAQGQRRTAAAALRSSYAAFLPSVSVSAGATRQLPAGARTRIENGQVVTLPDEPWSSSIGLGASVSLFEGGQRLFDIAAARARNGIAGINETAQQFAAALGAKVAYFDVLAARESQDAARAQLEQAEQQFRSSAARVRARTATRSDSLRGEIQVRSARLAMTEARQAIAVANAGLTRAVGAAEPVTAAGAPAAEAALPVDDATLYAQALDGPAVRQAAAQLDAARAVRRGSWSGYLPSVTASYSRSGNGTSDGLAFPTDEYSYSGSLRLSLSFPVFDQFRREEQVTQAQVAERNAEAQLRDARLAASESATSAIAEFHTAGERVESQTATLAAAEEDLRVQQQRYAVGGSTLLDVLTSQTQLDQARRDLIRARYDQRIARARLEALVGREL